jgi:fermentation-respiration switch protein FrsA (DUF1100 family)
MAGILFTPSNVEKARRYPALAVAHLFGGVKEQTAGIFIVGTKAATIFMSKSGYEKAGQPKEWFEIPGATHHHLYDDEAAVGKAVAKLEEFFGRCL